MLVVTQKTRIPGVGLTTAGELTSEVVETEQKRVFVHDWSSITPPTPEDFGRAEKPNAGDRDGQE